MILTIYALGAISTAGWFMWLLRDIPGDELSVSDYAKAGVMCGMISVVWPVFWAWLLIDMWRE